MIKISKIRRKNIHVLYQPIVTVSRISRTNSKQTEITVRSSKLQSTKNEYFKLVIHEAVKLQVIMLNYIVTAVY